MDGTITPGEASLAWTIGKRRKAAGGAAPGAFLGAEAVLKQIKDKTIAKRRVGFTVTVSRGAREGSRRCAVCARVVGIAHPRPLVRLLTPPPQGAPAREGAKLFAPGGGPEIGVITSGTFSPWCVSGWVGWWWSSVGRPSAGTRSCAGLSM